MKQFLSINRLAFELHISTDVLKDVATNKSAHYRPFIRLEKKRDGSTKERRIDNPDKAIRQIQKRINKIILKPECAELPLYMTGSIPDRSIRDNAKVHVGSEAILCVDISNCFPSIKSSMVYDVFKERLGCSPPAAKLLTKLTTYGNRLPQGAPTSPSLCNLVLEPMTTELNNLSTGTGLKFTQYIDDLTFSGNKDTLQKHETEILKLVEQYGFEVNARKLKLLTRNTRMEITGLVVNSFVSVGRRYIRRVERDIMRGTNEATIQGKISHVSSVSKKKAKSLKKKVAARKITRSNTANRDD